MKNIDTLVADIYELLETRKLDEGVDLEAICEHFGKEMAEILHTALTPEPSRGGLRLSAIGKPDRQIYNAYNGVEGEQLRGATYIKFLYGHLTEAMVLALTRAAGHEVTDEQKVCHVAGVKGHMDCRIDGLLVDVKSASSFGFKKFRNNELHKDDPFGYIGQLKAYAHSEGDSEYGWLVMDKANGTLCVLKYDEKDETAPYYDAVNWDVEERVLHLKKLVGYDMPPQHCYEPIPDGKSGNMKLPMGCSYCDFKFSCWPDVQTFLYSTGPRYLTTVVRDPRVLTVPKEF
jgi:hypothetical protein